jgi:mycothiol synthase
MLDIRPFEETDADYAAHVAIHNAIWPGEPTTVEEVQHWNSTRDPAYELHSFQVERNGKVVGTCVWLDPWWAARPGKYYIEISIHPDYQRQGIGSGVYAFLMAQLAQQDPVPVIVDSQAREDRARAVRFLEDRGFERVMRVPRSELEILTFDFERFDVALQRVEERGIRIASIAELRDEDPDWQRKLWDLEWELVQDVPSPDPLTRIPFDIWVGRHLGTPTFLPEAQVVAIDGVDWVGLSTLWKSLGDPKRLRTGFTGVARSHRRQGIATAMKVEAVRFARAYGAVVIDTDNEENNPMYQLNLKLGFQPRPAWLFYRKQIQPEEGRH